MRVAGYQEPAVQDEVLISVGVLDRRESPVTGLHIGDFQLFEDGVEQKISKCSAGSPASVAILIDNSASRKDFIAQAKQIVNDFLRAVSPGGEYSVFGISEPAQRSGGFTSDTRLVMQQVTAIKAGGPTALFDGIYRADDMLRSRPNDRRKILLIISDGDDNVSRRSPIQLDAVAGRPATSVYAVGPLASISQLENPITELTRLTGGRCLPDGAPNLGSKIAHEVDSQYTLRYRPVNTKATKYRKIKVEVRPPGGRARLKVFARPGYYAQ